MQKQEGQRTSGMAPAQPGRQNKVSAFFRQKKDWVKLNASYLVGTVTATTCAYGAAYVAEKAGMDRMQATTWVAGLAAYVTGTAAICLGWLVFQKDKYRAHPELIVKDMLKMAGNTLFAQAITWAGSWGATAFAVWLGASNFLAVTVQQVADRLIFIPTFNFLNRKRVRQMEKLDSPAP